MPKYDMKIMSAIVQNRMATFSVNSLMPYFQLIESQADEGSVEWKQLFAKREESYRP